MKNQQWGFVLAWGLRATMALGIVYFLVQQQWSNVGIMLVSLGASGLAYYVMKHYVGESGQYMDLMLALLIVFNNLLGLAFDFYHTVPYWDIATHYTTSLFLAVSALILLQKAHPQLVYNEKPIVIGMAIMLFALGLGGLWEIGEFLSDFFRQTDFQHGLQNTMQDLIVDLVAGLVVGFAWTQRKK
ncbi:MAG: hypothetical protein AABX02_02650 [archaeon]